MILITVVTVSIFCILELIEVKEIGPNVHPYNANGFWIMVGFSIYTYEGIGVVMPVMQASAEPGKF